MKKTSQAMSLMDRSEAFVAPKTTTKKLEFIVYVFGNSVKSVPVTVEIPENCWPEDPGSQTEIEEELKHGILNAIDPEGICRTKKEDDMDNEALGKTYRGE